MGVQGHLERPMSGKVELEGKTTGNGVQLTEQFVTGDSTLKVRKPYTITKQRERWTDEEHTRFLEALKLHGRAWKKIEEHVGTKTAVQIRSHAQKFFSKIVREPYNGDVADAKPIEIPPPRPKRKPAHPYPRKLVSLVKTRISIPAKLARSVSQLSSISEQENQSPVSVLSANSSDVSVRANSCTPKGSPHPVSSTLVPKAGLNLGSEVPENIPDDSISQLDSEYEAPNPEEVPLKQESISQNDDLLQKDQSSAQCLKLFGQTLYVNDCFGTSYVTPGTCKHTSLDKEEEKCLFARRDVPLEKVPANPCEDACSPVPLSWLTLSGSAALSTQNVQNPTPITAQPCAKKENQDKNEQDEVSSSGSNTGLASATSTGERSCNVEKPFTLSKLRKRTPANSEDCRKGFAPYKRRSPAPVSSTETAKD